MPKPGYKQITVSNALHARLKRRAKKIGFSMPVLIVMMLDEIYPEHLADEAGKEKENE